VSKSKITWKFRPVHVEWHITGKPNENEKKGTKSTARHAKNPSLLQTQTSYLRRKKMGVCIEQERVGVVLIQNLGTKTQKKEMKIQARREDREQVDRLTYKKKGRRIAINSSTG
jgi:hypothetical protein